MSAFYDNMYLIMFVKVRDIGENINICSADLVACDFLCLNVFFSCSKQLISCQYVNELKSQINN